jgi:hypothetical protein
MLGLHDLKQDDFFCIEGFFLIEANFSMRYFFLKIMLTVVSETYSYLLYISVP